MYLNDKLRIVAALTIIGISTIGISTQALAAGEIQVTLLGTGDPIPRLDRFGPATLVEVAGQELLFDVGRGATQRLVQLGIPLREIDAVFLTHFHHDHLTDIPDIWMTGWIPPPFGRRSEPFEVWGPTGTESMLNHLEQAFEANTKIRIPDELLPPAGIETIAHEFDEDGVVYEKEGVRVTAFAVNQGELIKPAYGYRIDYMDRSVVISGDTRFDENLIAAAQGADLIIHEVALASEELLASSEQFRRIVAHHTTPEEAGTVFAEVDPKLAVYTHLVMLSSLTIPEAPLASLITRTRTNYQGPLVIGEDLMSFIVDDRVSIYRAAR
ncbi:MAG: MBL fold metallo-hydrolase [Proteobacteria bacterium]|nr:MBL fold metallo-hydrolase [Pseudomonadota bacterium]